MVKYVDPKRANVTAQNIQKYRQYTFLQIVKEIQCNGDFIDFLEVPFHFKNLDEELGEYESYDGIDNFVKYFVKVQMNYQGGSVIAGNDLEKLFEFKVAGHHVKRTERLVKKKKAEQ